MHRYRSLNRFAVALALIAVFAGVRAGVQMFAAPAATFATLPNLNFNQGQTVTVAFAAQGFPTGITYTAQGLPAGLSMTMGFDTLGHEVGILSGTLAADTPTTAGSEGLYTNVRILASDGGVSNFFTIDVSHWNQGDVFVGAGEWNYQVYREDGTFKTNWTVPDDAGATFGGTTGCAVNWRTGEVWVTNFDEIYPALNVITRHSGSNPLPFTDPSRRLSTERYGPGNGLTPVVGNLNPFDTNPESVAFDNDGNMFVGHSFGYWNDDFDVADANGTPIILHNPNGAGWVYVDAAGLPILDENSSPIFDSAPISPAGFFEKWVQGGLPINILGLNGQPVAVPLQGGMDVHKYTPDVNGNYQQATRQFFDFHYGNTGIDTLDLLSDQKTMIYSSEDWYMYRYDVAAGAQLPVVSSSVLGESRPLIKGAIYGVRALPPGDGTGGYIGVSEMNIVRFDQNGRVVQYYDVLGDNDYLGDPDAGWLAGDVNGWFALAIAPDGRTFWAATRQDVFRLDVASGEQIGTKIHATVGTLHTNQELAGLCVMAEYRAAQEVCGVNGLGNGIDDDNDGTIDEGCFRVEICSVQSPGDDDGDGLVDYNDPDCGAEPSQQCVSGGPTDNSVAGICDRADFEGDTVVVPGIPLPCVDCSNWTFSYSAVGLPSGLTMNPTTGEVTGMPLFSIVNPNSELSAPVVFPITVNSTWHMTGQLPTSFSKTFNWTIYNRNRVPVADDDGPQAVVAGASVSFDVRLNDEDIDGDAITILSFTQPPVGEGTVAQVGQDLVYTAPASGFSGTTTFTYKLTDTYNPAGISNDATVTVIVNSPPVAVNDAYDGAYNTPLVINAANGIINHVPGKDSDPDGQAISVVPASVTSPSNGTVTVNADGSFTYTPNNGFSGVDTYQYRVTDGMLESNVATVTITIRRPPVAVDDSYTTPLNTPLTIAAPGIMANDSDPNGLPILVNVGSVGNVVNGTRTVLADGSLVYTPNANFVGTEVFQYRVTNGYFESNTAFVTIRVVDDKPVAEDDAFTTNEDVAVNATLVGNDDPSQDGGNVWSKTSNPSHGTATVNANGTFTYTPNAGYSGTDTFTYQICDLTGDCDPATVTITINAKRLDVVASPVCIADTPYVNFTITAANFTPVVGANATIVWKDSTGAVVQTTVIPWTNVNQPLTGQLLWPGTVVDGNGVATDWPGWLLQSGVWIQGSDGYENTRPTSTVEISVNPTTALTVSYPPATPNCNAAPPANRPPVAVNNAYVTAEDTPITVPAPGILANDSDPENGPLVVILPTVTQPTNGTLAQNADGSFTYTPNANFTGVDQYTYKVRDAAGLESNVATVTITITPSNDVPVAVNDAFTTAEDTPINGTLTGNDTPSPDGGNVWSKTTNPSFGTATVNANGTFSYAPNPNFSGTDSFTYTVCDVDGDCSTATVTIIVISVDDAPLAVNDAYTTLQHTAVSSTLTGNDTPSGDGGNVWTKTSNPSNGAATVNADGTFTYTPNMYFFGTDSFTYQVCDVDGDCATATATITVVCPPAAGTPTALVRRSTMFDAGARFEGNVQMMTAASATFNSNTTLVGDLFMAGTPTVQINGVPSAYGGTVDGTGLVTPTGYYATINSGASLGRIVRRTNPVALPTVSAPTSPAGSRNVVLNSASDPIGAWATLRDLTLNSNTMNVDVPAGNYGTFTANNNTSFTLGVVGATTPSVYNFQSLNMNGSSSLFVVGPVVVTVGNQVGFNAIAGNSSHPEWLTFNIASGGLNLNSTSTLFYGYTVVPNGALIVNSGAKLVGGLAADSLTVNSNARVILQSQGGGCLVPDDAPVAVNDNFTTAEDTPVTGTLTGNDTPSDDGGNVWSKTSNPANGSATVNPDGTFTYTPNANFFGTDTFTYRVCDADGDCSTATVTIIITSVNEVPLAVNDSYTVNLGQVVNGTAQVNDTPSPDGGNVWSTLTTPPASAGTLAFTATGAFTFTPAPGFSGTTSFNYRVCDIDGDCATATVTIIVNGCLPGAFTTFTQGGWGASPKGNNPAQQLANGFPTVYPGGFVQIGGINTLKFTSATAIKNFLPAGGTANKLTSSATNPTSTAAGVFAGQVLALQLNVDFSRAGVKKMGLGQQVIVSGEFAGWTVDQVLAAANVALGGGALPSGVTISELNTIADAINNNYDNGTSDDGVLEAPAACQADSAPVAANDAFTTTVNRSLAGTLSTNDAESADGGNVWSRVTAASHGTATVNANGTYTYTPATNYAGVDSFTYKLCDADGDCSTATVTITIVATNNVPVASDDAFTTTTNTALAATAAGNDIASADGGNVWTKTSSPAHGTVTMASNGSFSYAPATGYVGSDAFTYKLCDVNNDCSNATVRITINAPVSNGLISGDTATIGYWRNSNGQALIKKMNGSADAKNLGNWLAANFPYLFGANAGSYNMTGKTNTQVADFDKSLFSSDKKMAQVLGAAIASYVTNSTLAGGNYSVSYGFNYTSSGTGAKTYDVEDSGAAIGLANDTNYTIMKLLQQANLRKQQGNYDANAFNVIFSDINETGDIL